MNEDDTLTMAAFIKWLRGENMSLADANRLISVFENRPLNVDKNDDQTLAGLQIRLRGVLASRFGLSAQS